IILGETSEVPVITASDDVILGSVELTKVDSETSEKLEGATFDLYEVNGEKETKVDTYVTNKEGNINVENLRPGNYYFIETKAPVGYDLDNSKHEFKIVLGEAEKQVSVTVKDNIKKGSVELTKVDSETNQKLEGAIFDLYKVNDKATDSNKLIKAIKDLITPDSSKIGTYTTNKNGVITVGDLRPGNYYFVETKAPEGYNLDSSKQEFKIVLGETEKQVLVTAKDNIKKGQAILVKEDKDSGEALQGAVYGLYDSKGNLIEKVTTDENGQAIASTKLRPGNYYFKEIQAPKGYKVNNEKLSVEVKNNGIVNPETIVAKDSIILGSAKLIKVDSKTGGKLQGAVYGVYDSSNKLIEKVTTGSTGEVTATDLRPGKYYFQEITAPVGYNLNNTKYQFEIVLGETNKAPVITANDDVVLGSVSLTKEDSETNQKLEGATFDLYEVNGEKETKVDTYVTNKEGNINIENLRPGNYYFIETKAPLGYDLDSSKHEFKIVLGEAQNQVLVTVKDNIQKGSVSLTKEDSETGEKLQGATFDLYEVNGEKETKVDTYVTNKEGNIKVENLRPGSYYFVETKAPEGYNLDNSKHEFKIILGEAEKQASVTVKDNIKK
ncbi:SpaA isopeptide-forming pilin-related protein, partial [Clostridium sp. Ade.TY]|uniref:SpaA isopeptide-forming pilin-related protein n=1 Tax=Clostridium sp. Ade.TY TaxID=1391647 RepID=UPI0004674202